MSDVKVYAVTSGSWVSFGIEALFATEQAARDYIAAERVKPRDEWEAINDAVQTWRVFESGEAASRAAWASSAIPEGQRQQ